MMEQLLAHLWGDFLLQSDWMALCKKKPGLRGWIPAIVHATVYTCVFLLLTTSWKALLVIGLTHVVIDHYNFVSKLIWERNWLSPLWITIEVKPNGSDAKSWRVRNYSWTACAMNFGFSPCRPQHISFWLFVVIDNVLHLTINYAALRWL